MADSNSAVDAEGSVGQGGLLHGRKLWRSPLGSAMRLVSANTLRVSIARGCSLPPSGKFSAFEIIVAFVEPHYSKSQINRAGEILAAPEAYSAEDQDWASRVLANWRACHGYPINTFQATLRQKLKAIDESAIVAQRSARPPSF